MKKRDREEKHSRRLEEEIVLDMDWTDPVIDVNRRNKQSEARKKQKLFLCTAMVKRMVIEIVEETPAASAVGMIMKEVVEEAAKTGMIWKELENDEDILQRIVQKFNFLLCQSQMKQDVKKIKKKIWTRLNLVGRQSLSLQFLPVEIKAFLVSPK